MTVRRHCTAASLLALLISEPYPFTISRNPCFPHRHNVSTFAGQATWVENYPSATF